MRCGLFAVAPKCGPPHGRSALRASRTQTALRATLTKARPSLRQRFAIADDWQPEATAHRNGNRMNTTKFAAALAGGLTAGAIAVRLAAPASADTSGYVDALDSAGLIRP
jgi:hypothetical protein